MLSNLKIGNFKLKSNLVLAPMAGISDLSFRMLNRRFGCELAFVEMINCRSISHKSRRTRQMLSTLPKDRPLGVQLLGCEEEFILKALDVLSKHSFDVLDFNAACPAKKVIRRGEGASLLKSAEKLNSLLKLLVKNSKAPVTVKIRLGWDSNSVNAEEVVQFAQDAGVSAVFIHGRTMIQGYGGKVDYGSIRKVKEVLKIPVIASGDIFSAESAKVMLDETGCDGLAVARGSLGNPWIFGQIEGFLKDGLTPKKPDLDGIVAVMKEHLGDCVDLYGERIGVVRFRKFFSWYTKGFHRIRMLRERSSVAKTKEEMLRIIAQTKTPQFSGDFVGDRPR